MDTIGQERQVLLPCDSWYPKKEVAALVETFQNLELLCSVRSDTVLTNLWKGKVVYALVTAPKKEKRRLFLCTKDPREISFDWERSADKTTYAYGKDNRLYLPLAWYALRWKIEVYM